MTVIFSSSRRRATARTAAAAVGASPPPVPAVVDVRTVLLGGRVVENTAGPKFAEALISEREALAQVGSP